MNNLKLSIRPEIPTINTELNSSNTEEFQNKTLRPILKLQNELIVLYFENYTESKKIILNSSDKNSLHMSVQKIIQKNSSLKNSLISLIIALFTTSEYQNYISNQKEYNKRLTSMIIQRISDNILKK